MELKELKELGLQRINLDLSRDITGNFFAKEGDIGTRGLSIKVLNNSADIDTTGVSITMYARVGQEVHSVDATVKYAQKGEYELIYPTSILKSGIIYAELQLKKLGDIISSKKFKILVERGIITDSAIEGHDSYPLFEQLLEAGANEKVRVSNEQTRITDEEVRVSNEQTRIANEEIRELNETARDDAESLRGVRLGELETNLANFMSEVDNKLNEVFINVKNFGVIGDGVTDDTLALKTIMDLAVLNNYNVFFPKGTYELNSNEVWIIPKLKGEGAIIDITGSLAFKTVGNVSIEGITFNTSGNGGEDANTVTSDYNFISPNDDNVDYCYIKDVVINAIVGVNKRLRTAIYLPKSNFTRIENLQGFNIVNLLIAGRMSQNIFIDNVYGENIETLVNLYEPYNVNINNLFIKNTKEDSLWWMSKNTGRNNNGRDVLLIEGGSHIILNNIKGIWAIERVIYSQASNVTASNITSVNTGGAKFSGDQNDPLKRISNIKVYTLELIRTDKDVRDSMGAIYGVEDLHIENLTLRSFIDDPINQHSISGNNGSVIFNNVYVYGLKQPVFKKLTGVTENVYINNLYIKTQATGDADGLIMAKDARYTTVDDYINILTIKNVTVDTGNLTVRSVIFNPENNKIAKKIHISNTHGFTTSRSSTHMYGMETLIGAEYNNVTIRALSSINFLGSSLHGKNLLSNEAIKNFKIESVATNQFCTILINKPTSDTYPVLNYIDEIIYNRKNNSDSIFSFPIKNTGVFRVLIGDNSGQTEFSVVNGVITEVFNSGTHISTGSELADKITLYYNAEGFLTVRNRITNNSYQVKIKNWLI